jgi:hypothetical protein
MNNCIDNSAPVASKAIFKALQLIDDAQTGTRYTCIKTVALGLAGRLRAHGMRFKAKALQPLDFEGLAGSMLVPIVSDDGLVGHVSIKWTDRGNRAASRDLSFIPVVAPLLAV